MMPIWRVHGGASKLEEALREVASDPQFLATQNWDCMLEEAIEAMASRDPASELRRILHEISPALAKSKELLPQSRDQALIMIGILIMLMSLWVAWAAMHQSDRQLSSHDLNRIGHVFALEELEMQAEHSSHPLCLRS